ncbi:carboxylesterase family protein [Novipirellula artificiosorum]|uniref:Endo-1,4-beta-xylanase Z n=1 Tax=Novipirellula artificiosorum TaxID=2528016 RepID=A0A5C6DVT4_9BACT|nr:alpha/beta hydrolase-fold protein [Novipirellula artificiosorum]TWU40692.1 Endo-1,4-beta-xylanase Z precursor [Novipirellula artificiosorum]
MPSTAKYLLFSFLSTVICLSSGKADDAAAEPAAGKQVEQTFSWKDSVGVPYLIYLPRGYAESTEPYPLMLFLHGRGESNGPLSLVAKWGPPMMAERGDELPYILVSPQCPKDDFWSSPVQQSLLGELLDSITSTYRIDQDRVYLTGLSMGGYGSWRMAADHPDRFAAVAPICGAGNPEDGSKLVDVPIWAFHGTDDSVVPFEKSQEMVDAIKAAGGKKIRFTTLEHINHNSWSSAYATPELYQWMFSHQRGK